jgi:hypothetical protein
MTSPHEPCCQLDVPAGGETDFLGNTPYSTHALCHEIALSIRIAVKRASAVVAQFSSRSSKIAALRQKGRVPALTGLHLSPPTVGRSCRGQPGTAPTTGTDETN